MSFATYASYQDAGRDLVYEWYESAKAEDRPRTPDRRWQPYAESPINNKEAPLSPEYRGRAAGVGSRIPLPRRSKDLTNLLRSGDRQGKDTSSGRQALNPKGETIGGSRQEGSGDADRTKREGEGSGQPLEEGRLVSNPP